MTSDSERTRQRRELLAAREALAGREAAEASLRRLVLQWLAQADVRAVGFYWPMRGEPDLREVIGQWLAGDARRRAALPVVVGEVLEFHAWSPEAPLQAGRFGIPVPAHGRVLQPDCLLIPCVGIDDRRYRLGYGGGYYDRTLAQLVPWPLSVGIAFEAARVPTITPREHDLALDVVITEAGIC